jgi:hypothetical protein
MAVISPDTFDPLKRFISVRLAQGVPIVDADVNQQDDIRSFELRAFLKWFVGDGVPEGTDAFRIRGTGVAGDVQILAGTTAAPAGLDRVSKGLGHVGRCLVDGRDAIIETDLTLRGQALHVSAPGAAALATDWSVPTVPELPVLNGTVVLYLDTWDRLVTPAEDPTLIFPGLGTESASRLRREWVVRWTTDPAPPVFGDGDHLPGHGYYALARVTRRAGDPLVQAEDVTDLRERRLLVPPATLVEDLLGTTAERYRQGLDRPAVSFREAVNALLRGELPSTPDAPIAPDPAADAMSFAFEPAGGDMVAFWQSTRAGGDQVFAVRWPQHDVAAAATAAPTQVTTGVTHRLPHAIRLPGGDFLVVYETNQADVHYKRAPTLSGLGAAPEVAVAADAGAIERHPYMVRAGDRLVFLWNAGSRWRYRRRLYPSDWAEGPATWDDAQAGVEVSPVPSAPPSPAAGEVHAVEAGGRVYVAYRTNTDDIAVARLNPASAGLETWGGLTLSSTAGVLDQQPFLVADGTTSVWAFWRAGENGIFHQRHDVATNAWVGPATLVPGTDAPGNADSRTAAVRDGLGAIWLFWVSTRESTSGEIWTVRRNPGTGAWGEPRQVVAASGQDDLPFVRLGEDGVIWLFWRSNRSGQFDLYFKRLVTAI